MSKKTRSVLKGYFNAGDQPSEAQFADVFDSTLNLSGSNAITGSLIISGSTSDNADGSAVNLSVQGDITSSGNILASKLNTGQGLNELYDMDQNVKSTSAVTFASVNTGQGITEVHLMNQNVKNTDIVQFKGLSLTKANMGSLATQSTSTHAIGENRAGILEIRPMPNIAAGATSSTFALTGDVITAASTVLITTDCQIVVFVTDVIDGSCKIRFHNPDPVANYSQRDQYINIVVL